MLRPQSCTIRCAGFFEISSSAGAPRRVVGQFFAIDDFLRVDRDEQMQDRAVSR